MRTRFLALPFAICLALGSVGIVAADTAPGEGSYGGLDAITITAASVNPKTGEAYVAGEVACSVDFDWVSVWVDVAQVVGRFNTIRGSGWADTGGCLAADGTAAFEMAFYPDAGKFAPGRFRIQANADGEGGCAYDPEWDEWTCENYGYASFGPATIRFGRTR